MARGITIRRGITGHVTIDGILSIEQCAKLNTPRLLNYYKKYRRIIDIRYEHAEDMQKYSTHIVEVKALLDQREHIK